MKREKITGIVEKMGNGISEGVKRHLEVLKDDVKKEFGKEYDVFFSYLYSEDGHLSLDVMKEDQSDGPLFDIEYYFPKTGDEDLPPYLIIELGVRNSYMTSHIFPLILEAGYSGFGNYPLGKTVSLMKGGEDREFELVKKEITRPDDGDDFLDLKFKEVDGEEYFTVSLWISKGGLDVLDFRDYQTSWE